MIICVLLTLLGLVIISAGLFIRGGLFMCEFGLLVLGCYGTGLFALVNPAVFNAVYPL